MKLASTDWPQAASKVHEAFRIQVPEGGSFSGPFPLLSVVILESEMCVVRSCKEEMNTPAVCPTDPPQPVYNPLPHSPYSQPWCSWNPGQRT